MRRVYIQAILNIILVIYFMRPLLSIAGTFSDDFEGNFAKWTAVKGNDGAFKLDKGKLVISAPMSTAILMAAMPEWSDYTVECSVDDIGLFGGRDSEVMILFRWTPGGAMGNGYGLGYIGALEGMFGFWKLTGNAHSNIPPTAGAVKPSTGVWRIEAEKDDLRFSLNDQLDRQTKDNTFAKGRVAIYCAFASITIDDFLVSTIPAYIDKSQGKLTTTWGSIKAK